MKLYNKVAKCTNWWAFIINQWSRTEKLVGGNNSDNSCQFKVIMYFGVYIRPLSIEVRSFLSHKTSVKTKFGIRWFFIICLFFFLFFFFFEVDRYLTEGVWATSSQASVYVKSATLLANKKSFFKWILNMSKSVNIEAKPAITQIRIVNLVIDYERTFP